jgi:exonuclease VII small subunit
MSDAPGGRPSAEERLQRAEELLARLESTRAELERAAESENADAAIDALNDLAQLAKEVEAELSRARSEADAGA